MKISRHCRSRFTIEPSYVNIENLIFGRLAFKGMNPEIERMMENERLRKEEAESAKAETEVNDQEMAEHYAGTLGNTISRKFAPKRQHDGSSKVQSNKTGEELMNQGAKLVGEMRSQNRVWKKDDSGQSKKKRFMKPQD